MGGRYLYAGNSVLTPTERRAQYSKRWRLGNRPSVRNLRHGQTQRKLDFVRWVKLGVGCVDCGYRAHPAALELDHVRGDKVQTVSQIATSRLGWAKLQAEIAKCEIVCANCHRIRTERRKAERHRPDLRQGAGGL